MHLPLLFVLLMALIALSSACTRSVNPDIERGSSYVFQPGFPEILASSIGFLDEEDQGFIRVSAEIVKPSLIYRSLNDTSKARLLMEVRIVGVTDPSFSRTVQETIEVLYNPLQQQADEVDTYERTLDMDPGRYTVTISITDLNSNKVSSSSETTFIPNPEAPENNLATIRMEGLQVDQDGDQPTFLPINSYDVPSKVDSLLFLTQLTNQSSESPLWIQTRLLRFRSDASPARPMQFNNYGNSSLPYKGIEYDEYEIVRQTDRVLQQEGSVLLEIPVDPLSRGNYRFEVLIYEGEQEPTEDEESLLYKAREFAIKSENYPFLRTPRELAEPLVYLLKEDEYETMMAIEDDTQLKEAVDRFWLSNVQSLSDAGLTLEKYYQRVEEANKQFSNFKEGWKTDTGMMYVLFGQPWYVERQVNVMRWSYSYDRSDPETNFIFEQPKVKNEFFPFNNYLLLRSQGYYSVYYRQLQLWLSGGILQRDL